MLVKTGLYLGTGVDNKQIFVGFKPDLVFIHGASGYTAIRTKTCSGDSSFLGNTTGGADIIQNFYEGGFEVGTNANVNTNGNVYNYVAIKDTGAGDIFFGTYVGNGTDNTSIIPPFPYSPQAVMLFNTGATQAWRGPGHAGDQTSKFSSLSNPSANVIQSMLGNGIQIGTDAGANTNTTLYHYVGFRNVAGIKTRIDAVPGGYDGLPISVGFTPDFVLAQASDGTDLTWRSTSHVGDTVSFFDNKADAANHIQSFTPGGFTIGSNGNVNGGVSVLTNFIAIKSETTPTNFRKIFTRDILFDLSIPTTTSTSSTSSSSSSTSSTSTSSTSSSSSTSSTSSSSSSSTSTTTLPLLTSDLIAYYGFNEAKGSLILDSSPLRNHGRWSGTERGNYVAGKIRTALRFTGGILGGGTNTVFIPNISNHQNLTAVSVQAWVYLTDVSTTLGRIVDHQRSSPTNDGFYMWTQPSTGKISFGVRPNNVDKSVNSPVLPLNQWIHIVGTWAQTTIKIYVNAELITSSTTVSGNLGNTSAGITIGNSGSAREFPGIIDEVAIWSKDLPQEEITQLYNNGKGLEYPFVNIKGIIGRYGYNPIYDNQYVNWNTTFYQTIGRILVYPTTTSTTSSSSSTSSTTSSSSTSSTSSSSSSSSSSTSSTSTSSTSSSSSTSSTSLSTSSTSSSSSTSSTSSSSSSTSTTLPYKRRYFSFVESITSTSTTTTSTSSTSSSSSSSSTSSTSSSTSSTSSSSSSSSTSSTSSSTSSTSSSSSTSSTSSSSSTSSTSSSSSTSSTSSSTSSTSSSTSSTSSSSSTSSTSSSSSLSTSSTSSSTSSTSTSSTSSSSSTSSTSSSSSSSTSSTSISTSTSSSSTSHSTSSTSSSSSTSSTSSSSSSTSSTSSSTSSTSSSSTSTIMFNPDIDIIMEVREIDMKEEW